MFPAKYYCYSCFFYFAHWKLCQPKVYPTNYGQMNVFFIAAVILNLSKFIYLWLANSSALSHCVLPLLGALLLAGGKI